MRVHTRIEPEQGEEFEYAGPVSISHCYNCPLMFDKRKQEYGMRCSDFQCGGNMRSDKKETHFKLK